jgi:3-oxoadipate enol-lactonase
MPIAQLASASIHYERSGSGPSLIFAHGAGGNHRSWWQQVPHFESDYDCVAFDHPGFGQSRWSDNANDDVIYGDVLIELLDHLKIDRTTIIAQSMGGWTAIGVHSRQPERLNALVFASTAGGVTAPGILEARAKSAPLVQGQRERFAADPEHAFNPALGERAQGENSKLHSLYGEIAADNPPGAASDRSRWGEFEPEVAESITIPTLLINGDEDNIAPYASIKTLADLIPNNRLEVIKQSGHSGYFERPAQFNELVGSFLSDSASG